MPGPRVHTIEEVQALVPKLERVFARVDVVRAELRALHIRVTALELIWADKIHERECPDHLEFLGHLEDMKSREDEVEKLTKRVARLGGQVKSLDPALVDFYGVREGRLIHWCWTRGETTIEHWHHVDQGFQSRHKV